MLVVIRSTSSGPRASQTRFACPPLKHKLHESDHSLWLDNLEVFGTCCAFSLCQILPASIIIFYRSSHIFAMSFMSAT